MDLVVCVWDSSKDSFFYWDSTPLHCVLYGRHFRHSTCRIVGLFFIRRIEDWKVSTWLRVFSSNRALIFAHLYFAWCCLRYRVHVDLCILCTVGSSWSKWTLCLTGVCIVDLQIWRHDLVWKKYDETGISLQMGILWPFQKPRNLLKDTIRLFGSTHGPELLALFTRCVLALNAGTFAAKQTLEGYYGPNRSEWQ